VVFCCTSEGLLTFAWLVSRHVQTKLLWVGLSVTLGLIACQRGPSGMEGERKGSSSENGSITTQVAESLTRSFTSEPQEPSGHNAPLTPAKKDSLQKKAQSLPPPKKEPWMDTLTDLTGVPPPNTATLISEDPVPLNKSSVELLIASQFQGRKPEELVLRVYVSEEGTVLRYQLLKSSNPKLGPEYFVRPLLELRFRPAQQNERRVAAWTILRLQIPNAL
jgi:hypothetical protein